VFAFSDKSVLERGVHVPDGDCEAKSGASAGTCELIARWLRKALMGQRASSLAVRMSTPPFSHVDLVQGRNMEAKEELSGLVQ
jgi:hypothetical protein